MVQRGCFWQAHNQMGLGNASSGAIKGNPEHTNGGWGSLWASYVCPTEKDLEVTVEPIYVLTHIVSSRAGLPTPASARSPHHTK